MSIGQPQPRVQAVHVFVGHLLPHVAEGAALGGRAGPGEPGEPGEAAGPGGETRLRRTQRKG